MQHGWSFCVRCGEKIAFSAPKCPHCGSVTARGQAAPENISSKSYGTAVALCGVFGIVGVHHFYIGNIVHGFIDFGLFAATVFFYLAGAASADGRFLAIAGLCFLADVVHTIFVFFRLIVGKQHDGAGRLIAIPSG
ncbi:NINE protein [uncultured Martelella sp.]|uniref:NINE protein n=1 Tax=uncultured Martelella sp. TaxID=392331 RepID=UPI0029C75004|nr:NINE protein [uncultured Martelella sp.]